MATDQGPVVQSALLRSELVRLRLDKGLTQEKVAHSLDWHASKLIRIEGGRSNITITDLRALLNEYDVRSEGRRERLEGMARGARQRGWWNDFREVIDEGTLQYAGYLTGSSVIRHFQNSVIPGPLQTRAYGEVLTSNYVEDSLVEQKVEFRSQQQKALERRAEPPRRFYVLDEAVIRRQVGVRRDPNIMPEQLRHLADLADGNELITVRIVPFSAGAYPGMEGPFVLLEFDGGAPDLLYLEASSARQRQSAITTDETTVSDYRSAFESILDEALSSDESITMLRDVADQLQGG